MPRNGLIPVEDVHAELIQDGVPILAQQMTTEKVFWAFCTPNLNLTSWLFGIIAAQGLSMGYAIFAIVLGNLFGATLAGLCGVLGPQTRFSSLEGSKFSFGRAGVKLPAFLNWVNSIGWDAVNNIPAAAALVALVTFYAGAGTPIWVMLAALSVVQMAIAIYGHHLVQIIAKYMGFLLSAIFLFLGVWACFHIKAAAPTEAGFSLKAFVLAFSVAAMGSAGYTPYAADYTRYLPADTPKYSIFLRVFSGLFLSYIIMETFGIVVASAIQEQTPDSLMAGLQSVCGGFAPLVLLAAGVGVIPANAMNDNSAAYCLVSSGIRVPRPLSAALAAAAGFGIAVYGAGHLGTIIQDTLLLLFYWIAPWTAIVLVHAAVSRPRDFGSADEPPTTLRKGWLSGGWTSGATIFCVVTVATIGLFASNDLYTGPIAARLGGVDIGYYVGFCAAGILYWLAQRRRNSPA
ncbi:MAG: cytosine permease [Pseudomonadota bacterium]|nr:cytosine permease [Pseudomonadota bacterium]